MSDSQGGQQAKVNCWFFVSRLCYVTYMCPPPTSRNFDDSSKTPHKWHNRTPFNELTRIVGVSEKKIAFLAELENGLPKNP